MGTPLRLAIAPMTNKIMTMVMFGMLAIALAIVAVGIAIAFGYLPSGEADPAAGTFFIIVGLGLAVYILYKWRSIT